MAHMFNKLAVASFMVFMAILMATLITEARPSIRDSLPALPPYNLREKALGVGRQVLSGPLPLPPHNSPALGICPAFNIGIDNHVDGQAWIVQITNLCRCSATNVILNCPNFSSGTSQIDPEVFTINGDGTCTVKKGKAMTHGEIISFKYYQVMKQNLSVRSVNFGC